MQDDILLLEHLRNQSVPSEFTGEALTLLNQVIFGGFSAVLQQEGLPVCFLAKGLLEKLGYDNQSELFRASESGKLLELVHPDDQDRLADILTQCHTNYTAEYRVRRRDGAYLWVQDFGKAVRNAKGQVVILCLHIDITDKMCLQQELERKSQEFEEYNRTLAALTSNVPGGVCEVALDQELTILYGNRSFYSFYGYTPAQMKQELDNKLYKTIWPEDLALVDRTLREAQRTGKQEFKIEHRVIRRDGAVCWSYICGNICITEEKSSIHCVIVDITKRKSIEEELRVNEERFRIALAQTDNTIFDYDIKTKRMLHGDKSAEKYGLSKWTDNVPEALVEGGTIHPDNREAFYEMYQKIRAGEPNASCIIQTKLVSGSYGWRKISMTNVYDGEGNPVRAIGFLEDIDDQKRREEALRDLSERDTLTGLLNKGTTEKRISQWLSEPHEAAGALFIIDIDDFKNVNDSFGHLFGDHVISESGRRIAELFHSDDIMGRIGGDEFIVFMKDLPKLKVIEDRARVLCETFQKSFDFDGKSAEISCSIGIVVTSEYGTAFTELYTKADIALYNCKKNGKNRYGVYIPEMGDSVTTSL